jgi:arabinogalactan endo-1,4-beta-galactosidase
VKKTILAAALALCPLPAFATELYFGADLSYAGQMLDCKAVYRDNGTPADIFTIFKNHGANLIRVRIWTDGNKGPYSNLPDVIRVIRAARAQGMEVLLDFHYSDSWADAGKQIIPAGWADIHDTDALADTLYRYTAYIMATLDHQGLMPEMVQVGNEINPEMLMPAAEPKGQDHLHAIDWARNARLVDAGIRAVREAGAKSRIKPRIMLQIAQPENVEPWFAAAAKAGVTDFDLIGISYYGHMWSTYDLPQTGDVIRRLRAAYPNKDVMLVETAFPYGADLPGMHSNLSAKAAMPGYDATPEGQKKFLVDLTRTVLAAGGDGVNYWAPDLVPNSCPTRNTGSRTSLFDLDGNTLPAIDFMKAR